MALIGRKTSGLLELDILFFSGNLLNSVDYPKTKASATFEKKTVILEPHQLMNERGCEHPSINRKFVGKKYVFTYVIGWLESVNKGTVLSLTTYLIF